ncbi:hypothetical protein [Paenibacillus hunanensis]|uniref:Transcriptional regulator n=1 Tax=Paenibacillus hunanensis TaxID=539262 RepID=A0ABU1IW64_9BACL|nr:hypothetical protein [Paenibacillus hunanensis]MDR6243166.1 hypothetical protein [Paenibacillus hunanensis]GGJ11326.1 hypothetical protein GCM10008022_20580 [Paenibacillus hunanensis]
MEQMQWLPEANPDEYLAARSLLRRYKYMKKAVTGLQQMGTLTLKQQCKLREYADKVANMELAVSLILDPEVRDITDHVFLQGNNRQTAIYKLRWHTERTVDRRIRRGVISVANTLKDWGII